jgi:Pregnancy-associated plasma protein-A/Secretion system C-terminal sorting domain/Fibronectin type III domain
MLLFTSIISMQAQAHRQCGTTEHMNELMLGDPSIARNLESIERFTQHFIADNPSGSRTVVTIPVVVHVVYNTATQNISDAQINSQIDILNNDYRKLNADISSVPSAFSALAADCEVNFCLAQRTPTGASTNGIVRVSTTTTSFSSNDRVKSSSTGGDNAWDATQYLNIWVCNLGGGLLGYAQFPGGPASTDGVVINYTAFGNTGTAASPYNLGRTATHEVGHWLNLRHIWGDATCGDDLVGDTPTQNTSNFGCPAFPHVTCSNGPNGDMWMNYMDYTDDACMYMFTTGQKTRMQSLFAAGGSRVGLTTSLGCSPVVVGVCNTPTSLSSASITSSSATLSWAAVSGAASYNLQYKLSTATSWTTVNTSSTSYSLTGLSSSSTYNFQVQTVCSSSSSSAYSAAASFTTLAPPVCNTPTGLSASSISSSGATLSWTAVSGASSYNIQYKLSTASTWTTTTSTTNSKVLTGLAASSTYNFQVQTVCSATSSSAYSAAANFSTSAAGTCGTDSYEPNASLSAASAISTGTSYTALICPTGDEDWYRFSNISTARNFRVRLTTLPADYDIEIYNSAGTYLGTSNNGGTTNESFSYNGGAVGTYYVRVFGYSGAYNSSSRYTLNVTRSSSTLRLDGTEDGENVDMANAGKDFLVYPNPSTDQFTIRFFNDQQDEAFITMYDISGKVVMDSKINAVKGVNSINVNSSEYASGMYTVVVQNGSNHWTQRVQIIK